MKFSTIKALGVLSLSVVCWLPLSEAVGQENPDLAKIKQALKISPKQRGVDIDVPEAAELNSCRIARAVDTYEVPGWLVYDNTGRLIRVFLDKNKDGDLDQWSYYKNGIEVYRDMDSNFDKKQDQYRWMGSAGIRWGIDTNQDRTIDFWKTISAAEVSEEIFYAFQTNDVKRFERLLITPSEIEQLELGEKMSSIVSKSVSQARSSFAQIAKTQRALTKASQFVDFGGARPALVPAGRENIEQDIVIYDNAQTLYETGSKYGQISLGTIVRVGDKWRILEAPEFMSRTKPVSNGGLFFPLQTVSPLAGGAGGTNPVSDKLGKMFEQYESLEKKLANAKPGKVTTKLQQQRANLFVDMIAEQSSDEDRKNWLRQMSDTVSSAYQRDLYPQGLEFLEAYLKKQKAKSNAIGLDYVEYRVVQARSHKGMQGNSRARAEANDRYMENLEDYVGAYPRGEFTSDALMQLALFAEVSEGRDSVERANEWYQQVVKGFADSREAAKAAGAIKRLNAIGNPLEFRSSVLNSDSTFDVRAYAGKKMVVIHYWATWCEACVEDFDELKRLKAKHKGELSIIGANLDEDSKEVVSFLRGKGVTWPQLWAEGGLDASPVATQLGVTTLPLTILIDKDGKVLENEASVNDLDRDIQRAIRNQTKSATNRRGGEARRN